MGCGLEQGGLCTQLSAQEPMQPMFCQPTVRSRRMGKSRLGIEPNRNMPLHAYTQKEHPQTDIEQDTAITGKTEDPRHRSKSLLAGSALVSGHLVCGSRSKVFFDCCPKNVLLAFSKSQHNKNAGQTEWTNSSKCKHLKRWSKATLI
jgi:hypothetical protein